MNRFIRIAGMTFLLVGIAQAQPGADEMRALVGKIDHGQSEEVRKELPDLIAKYQNSAGVLYLQGRVATDGIEAVKFYQGVLDNYPKSEWADDALFRIYQYYQALGRYRTAEERARQLRKDYPSSPYIAELVVLPKQDSPVTLAPADSLPVDTLRVPPAEPPVKPRPASPAAGNSPPPAPTQSTGKYTLQTGAFSSVANAEKQKGFFKESGYGVEITNKIRGGRSLYLVWVGSFRDAQEARALGKEIRAKYRIDPIVVERY